jgi:hypothetical protein
VRCFMLCLRTSLLSTAWLILSLSSLWLGSGNETLASPPESPRPNVLFILCDDLRPDAVGCLGSQHVKTPHIDALAEDGVRFENSFCTTSLCSPSRASILTGLYAHAHGVRNNFTELPTNLPHWPGQLQRDGYATAYIGKWHMGEGNDCPRPGFDWFVSHKGQGKYFDTEWNINGLRRETPKGYYTTHCHQLLPRLAAGARSPRDRGRFVLGTRHHTHSISPNLSTSIPSMTYRSATQRAPFTLNHSLIGSGSGSQPGMAFMARYLIGEKVFRTVAPKPSPTSNEWYERTGAPSSRLMTVLDDSCLS